MSRPSAAALIELLEKWERTAAQRRQQAAGRFDGAAQHDDGTAAAYVAAANDLRRLLGPPWDIGLRDG
jgi:hypothetical protein